MTRPIKVLADARALLADVERRTAPEARDALKAALAEVASTDGDRVLDGFEAEALRDSFNAVLGAGQTLGADQVDALRDALSLKVSELKAGRIQDTEVMFTSEGRSLDRFRGKILESMDATIAKADGKPVDASGTLASGKSFVGADELRQILLDDHKTDFHRAVATKMLTYAIGRGVDWYDKPAIDQIVKETNQEN